MTAYEKFVRMSGMKTATQTIIDLFGGVSGLALAIGRRPSTVQYWRDQDRIPPKNHAEVVAAVREHAPKVVEAAVAGPAASS